MIIPEFSKGIPVFVAPINEATKKWGVYSIPMLWRTPDQKLHIRINGEQDLPYTKDMQQAPNLYFVSLDNGETWSENFDDIPDYTVFTGISSPYLKLKNGKHIAVRGKKDLAPITDTEYRKEFILPNGEAVVHSYRYGDIKPECKGIELLTFDADKSSPMITDAVINFPQREVLVNSAARVGENEYLPEIEYLQQYIFKRPYFCALTEISDGTLLSLAYGQHPDVKDRYCGVVYCLESKDLGKTWSYRGTVAKDSNMPNGYSGDGNEITMAQTENGNLICAMRMDMSKGFDDGVECGTAVAVSHDLGFTWGKPYFISGSSVTPQIVSLNSGVTVVVYGRPGVHLKYTHDNGKSWSKEYTVIGKTLKEELESGKSYWDAKYGDTSSYSNVFVEPISDSELIILYNDAKYDNGDGLQHKATMVKKVSFNNIEEK